MSTTLTIADGPKMLREALCVAEHAVNRNVEPQNQHGAPRILAALIAECDRHRPLGPDGKHGDRHTDTCGCDDVPLDPSKVKAGDTVTVSGGGTEDRPVYEITGVAWEPSHSPGTLWVGPVCISAPLVTLTAHQPAPEPEPEWKPGTVAVVVQGGDPGAGVDDHEFRAALQTDGMWVGLAGEAATSAPVSVRPLVVIDPAAVDVEALAEALRREWSGKDFGVTFSWDAIARTLLAALGIEATS